jgi:hypothetical protein
LKSKNIPLHEFDKQKQSKEGTEGQYNSSPAKMVRKAPLDNNSPNRREDELDQSINDRFSNKRASSPSLNKD